MRISLNSGEWILVAACIGVGLAILYVWFTGATMTSLIDRMKGRADDGAKKPDQFYTGTVVEETLKVGSRKGIDDCAGIIVEQDSSGKVVAVHFNGAGLAFYTQRVDRERAKHWHDWYAKALHASVTALRVSRRKPFGV